MKTFKQLTAKDTRIIGITAFGDKVIVATPDQLYEVVEDELKPIYFNQKVLDSD